MLRFLRVSGAPDSNLTAISFLPAAIRLTPASAPRPHYAERNKHRQAVRKRDFLFRPERGLLVVMELKVIKGPDAVVGRLMRYKGWLKRHRATKQVRIP